MDIIFLVIIIGVILSKAQKKKAKEAEQPKPNQPRTAQPVPNREFRPKPSQPKPNQPVPNQPRTAQRTQPTHPTQRTQPSAEERLKMQNLKAELQKKHGSAKKAQQKPTVDILLPKEENIVNRASDNVLENDADILRMQMDAAREDNYGSSIAGIQMESPLMKEVEDLMIKGYSGGLTNPRDFVAEGIALLNSYELQETE
uniref:hypothetical protein n=1 Tax=Roseburia sp. TaxID=2049040 RepID=UPI003FEF808E